MLKFGRAVLGTVLLLAAATNAQPTGPLPTYFATITPTATSALAPNVAGTVTVFVAPNGVVGYTGILTGLEPNLQAATCLAVNGCGVHIHDGFSCLDAATQGGHYFVNPPVATDPWVDARYSSDAFGNAAFGDQRMIGTGDIQGRAFLVHASDGSRVGCGLLQRIPYAQTSYARTVPIPGVATTAMGEVTIYSPGTGTIYLMGQAIDLEPNLVSFVVGGPHCGATNGCGTHIHAGFSCDNSTVQGGHLYDTLTLPADPWAVVGYPTTDGAGSSTFIHTIQQGVADITGRAFIVHLNDGSRASCGLLQAAMPPPVALDGALPTYEAMIQSLGGNSVAGIVTVFTTPSGVAGYTGIIGGLEFNLDASSAACTTFPNGCGVHIHSGFSCDNTTTQGGHYFVPPVTTDPWVDARYSSDAAGEAVFGDWRSIGTTDVEGRVFIVHAADGSRVGCGPLVRIPVNGTAYTQTTPIPGAPDNVIGEVTIYPLSDGRVHLMGQAFNLETDLASFTQGGPDCTATNGCGTHIHSGFSCADSTAQGGHFFDPALPVDPWAIIGYPSTSSLGFAYFVHTVRQGGPPESFIDGRAFIVHRNDGSRASCGVLAAGPSPAPPTGPLVAYSATIFPLGMNTARGTVTVFIAPDGVVGYTGDLTGLQPNLQATTCLATNGCGVHIHSGFSCDNTTTQGGHYFVPPITSDPWVDARYSSDANGNALFGDWRNIGTSDVAGRAFLVHAEDGSRIGCGILQRANPSDTVHTLTTPIPNTNNMVHGEVTIYNPGTGTVYLMGKARGLEPELVSFTVPGGTDCTATNGCGVHIHAGLSCANSSVQLGHLWNMNTLTSDPWATVNYPRTDAFGEAKYFVHTVQQDVADILGRAFIVHLNDGSRASCGLLEAPASPAPTIAPTASCVPVGASCSSSSSCCDFVPGTPSICTGMMNQASCASCAKKGFTCSSDSDCCFSGMTSLKCSNGVCTKCAAAGKTCTSPAGCCTAMAMCVVPMPMGMPMMSKGKCNM